MRNKLWVGLSFSLLATCAAPAFAADHIVQVGVGGGLTFTPATVTIQAGDTVTFQGVSGFHNAVSDPGTVTAFRCGPTGCGTGPNDGQPGGGTWTNATVTFPTAGTIGYFCEVHGQAMRGTIAVNPVPVTLQQFEID